VGLNRLEGMDSGGLLVGLGLKEICTGDAMTPGEGLTTLKTEELKKLLGLLHRGELNLPFTAQSVACAGFQYRSGELMAALRDLEEAGVRAVLVCVLAERLQPLTN
jgi:hypothetical protein